MGKELDMAGRTSEMRDEDVRLGSKAAKVGSEVRPLWLVVWEMNGRTAAVYKGGMHRQEAEDKAMKQMIEWEGLHENRLIRKVLDKVWDEWILSDSYGRSVGRVFLARNMVTE